MRFAHFLGELGFYNGTSVLYQDTLIWSKVSWFYIYCYLNMATLLLGFWLVVEDLYGTDSMRFSIFPSGLILHVWMY